MTLPAAASRAIAIELAAAPAGTRELRHLPFRRLSFGTRKRRANQPPMHGAVVFTRALLNLALGSDRRFLRMLSRFFRELGLLYRHLFWERLGRLFWERLGRRGFVRDMFGRRLFLSARRRNASLLVFMVRVARGAARLLHLIINHRHDRVIGDAAFTRTIVVQNVTKPKPALLHLIPPEPFLFRRDRKNKRRR